MLHRLIGTVQKDKSVDYNNNKIVTDKIPRLAMNLDEWLIQAKACLISKGSNLDIKTLRNERGKVKIEKRSKRII